jgi:aminopeptidase
MLTVENINKIIRDAIGVKSGDIVLLQFWGDDSDRDLIHEFSNVVASFGGSPIELQHSRENYGKLFKNMEPGCFNEKFFKIFDPVDIVIDICMYQPVIPSSDFPKEHMDLYRVYMRTLFQTLVQKKKLIQLRVPTKENALESGLSYEIYKDSMLKAYDIDYRRLQNKCTELIDRISKRNSIRIKTKQDLVLNLSLKDRQWNVDAGDGDMPCGEIYIAPLEDETNGKIYFAYLTYQDFETDEKRIANDVIITVENGKMITSSCDDFNKYLKNLPQGGNIICEFGIGLNPGVNKLLGYDLLDEKMIGTFHIAIGNNTMFGGRNDVPLHKDFVGFGNVYMDDEQIL